MSQSTDKTFTSQSELLDWLLTQRQYAGFTRSRLKSAIVSPAERYGSWEDSWIRITHTAGTFTVSFLQ